MASRNSISLTETIGRVSSFFLSPRVPVSALCQPPWLWRLRVWYANDIVLKYWVNLTFNPTLVRREGVLGIFFPAFNFAFQARDADHLDPEENLRTAAPFSQLLNGGKKTHKKQKWKKKKKSTLCLTICWTISQSFGIWPVRLERERVYFELVGSIFQSQFLLITQFISTWSSNWIQSTLLALKPNYNQRKETNEFNPCKFCPRNVTPTYPLHPNQTWGSSSFFLRIASGSKTSDW